MNTSVGYKFIVYAGVRDANGKLVDTVISFGRDIDPKKYKFKSESDCGGEGYSCRTHAFSMEGDTLVHEMYSYSRDCDGPLERWSTRYATTEDSLLFGNIFYVPVWGKEKLRQRDHYAENMNY